MKAIVYNRYGPASVLHLSDIEKPTPNNNEILLHVKSTAVNSGDIKLRKADPFAVRFFFGLLNPKINILGSVFSGEVEEVGENVTRYKVGDQLFGHTDMRLGAYAEYIIVSEEGSLALKPADISHNEAAAIPFGGVTALHFLKKVKLKALQKVLIVGASGAVGSAALQLAKWYGATVTAVCSTVNVDWVKSLGADYVIDYTKEDFTLNREIYDVIFDTVNAIPVFRSLKSLKKNGVMILSAAGLTQLFQGAWISFSSNRKIITGITKHSVEDIAFLKELVVSKKFKPVIDKIFPMQYINEAHSYVEQGHKKGNVIIEV